METLLNTFQNQGFKIKDGKFIESEIIQENNGTLIRGTSRGSDLIPAFMGALRNMPKYKELVREISLLVPKEALEDDDHEFWSSDTACKIVLSLIDILDNYAPDDYYFGITRGDSSDYGFWKEPKERRRIWKIRRKYD